LWLALIAIMVALWFPPATRWIFRKRHLTMDRNPYSPPAASVADIASSGTLYSPRQIYLASFLGSPIAAAWFIHRNFMTLGNESRALRTLGLGFAATVAVLVAGFYLPNRFPNLLLPLAYSFAIYQYALFLFKGAYNKHLTEGGLKGSWWMVIGVSLLAILILIGIVCAIAFAVPSLFAGK
jgi:hypothetical protein